MAPAGGPQRRADAEHANPAGQGALFEVAGTSSDPTQGYRVPTAMKAAGITYRQLDYWARTGLVEPSVRGASGSGTQRLYSFRDVLVLKVVKKLLDTGVSLQNIRAAVEHLRARGVEDLSQLTLVSDGASVLECRTPDEVVDLLRGGQCVFAIAVGNVVPEVQGSLAQLPAAEQGVPAEGQPAATPADELSTRRRRRDTA